MLEGSRRSLRRGGSSDRATDDTVLGGGFGLDGPSTCRPLRLPMLLWVRFCVEDEDDDVLPDCQNGQSLKSFVSDCDLWWWWWRWSAIAMVCRQNLNRGESLLAALVFFFFFSFYNFLLVLISWSLIKFLEVSLLFGGENTYIFCVKSRTSGNEWISLFRWVWCGVDSRLKNWRWGIGHWKLAVG